MRPQEERIISPYTATERTAGQSTIQKPDYTPAISASSPFQNSHTPAFISTGAAPEEAGQPVGLQEAHITSILRSMSIGHLSLGVALAPIGMILEAVFHEPAFFGLAASGGMLGVCGLITLLAANRQRVSQSPLAFYLLPYADFVIVGLWLLLFSVSGAIVLFYAYVVVSAALLLGSRHAIALAGIAGATILAISLGQYQDQIMPAITLPLEAQITFTIVSTVLALGLIAYVARLFSLNLDRFIATTNRQKDELLLTRRDVTEQQEQIQEEMESLSNTYVRFMAGDTEIRAPVPNGSLALAAHLLNTLLEQMERLARTAAVRARMEERISELTLALGRLSNGDPAALQSLNGPSGTSLDGLTLALARTGRQLILLQQSLQYTAGGFTAVMGISSDLSMVHQTLSNTDSALHELQARAEQSAVHLHTMLEGEGSRNENRSTERPFLREMELRVRQQGVGLELLRARLGHIGSQMETIENELRRVAENMEQITRGTRPARPEQPGASLVDMAAPGAQLRPINVPPPTPDSGSPVAPAPMRPASGALRTADALPRRFTGPLSPPSRAPEKPEPWQTPLGQAEHEASGPRH
ncbi:MAG TPA: hypothetical protein VH599_06935 [Ktedonobacterales bacterium]|jgi:hypothetical protein